MTEYDNTLILYDRNGEIEFQVVDRISYNGEKYLVLWDEGQAEIAVVVERNGDYETVDDPTYRKTLLQSAEIMKDKMDVEYKQLNLRASKLKESIDTEFLPL